MSFRQWFDRYCETAEDGPRWQIAFSHPVLLIGKQILAMKGQIEHEQAQGQPQAEARMERLAELDALRVFVAKDARRYPAGAGPVEQAAARVTAGEFSLDDAVAWLSRPEQAEHLGSLYSHLLVFHAEQAMQRGDWLQAMLWSRLLAQACRAACPPGSCSEALEVAGIGWIQIVGVVLGPHPDGERFAAARDFGLDLLQRLQQPQDQRRRADVLHALGSLHSDPVTSSTGAGTDEFAARQQQGAHALQHGELAAHQLAQHPLPDPPAMLETAASYFEQALQGREGQARGLTLKALAQTHAVLARMKKVAPDHARIQAWCDEALGLLQEGSYQHQATLTLLQQCGLAASASANAGAAAPSQATAGKPDTPDTPDTVLMRMAALRPADPAAALALLEQAEPLFAAQATEAQRTQRLASMVQLMPVVFGAADLGAFPTPIEAAANAVAETAAREHWPQQRIGATMFALAVQSSRQDAEAFGIRLLELALGLNEALAERQAPVALLYAQLHSGAAVNALNAGHPAEAVRLYAQALAPYLRLPLEAVALDHIQRIADLAGRPDPAMADQVLQAIAPLAFEVERCLGSSGVQALQHIYERAIGGLQGSVSANLLGMLIQLAKGARFDSELRTASPYDWRSDDDARALLARIASLRASAAHVEVPDALSEVLLVSAVSELKPEGGAGARQIAFLQQLFDRHVERARIQQVHSPAIVNPEIVHHLLDSRTVLLDYYFAVRSEQARSLYIVAYTCEGVTAFCNPLNDARQLVADTGQAQVLLDSLALRTLQLRADLQADPGDLPLSDAARARLADDFHLLLGEPAWNWLQQQRQAGREHLCIRPHQALRYYPMQLLGRGDQDLATQWTVTLLPSLQTLLQPRAAARSGPGRALGISYADPRYAPLPELPAAVEETTQVAALMGSAPVLEDAVTETALLEALTHAPSVHLCLHGLHLPAAPLFHQLVLGQAGGPAGPEDGRLCAYELQGLDLRGLRVLTLGSCDSALGRFDAGDNLSGLPATLLAAGTQTVVGALWELADAPALLFFTTFHRELATGQPRLEAFRAAQQATRAAWPQARDWAAFCYLGDWDRPAKPLPEGLLTHFELG